MEGECLPSLHTWPVLPCDHKGKQDSVEQAHCTPGAVKRYWDTPCVGGRHNFFWVDTTSPFTEQSNNFTVPTPKILVYIFRFRLHSAALTFIFIGCIGYFFRQTQLRSGLEHFSYIPAATQEIV